MLVIEPHSENCVCDICGGTIPNGIKCACFQCQIEGRYMSHVTDRVYCTICYGGLHDVGRTHFTNHQNNFPNPDVRGEE